MAAMTSFPAEKCCRLLSASARRPLLHMHYSYLFNSDISKNSELREA